MLRRTASGIRRVLKDDEGRDSLPKPTSVPSKSRGRTKVSFGPFSRGKWPARLLQAARSPRGIAVILTLLVVFLIVRWLFADFWLLVGFKLANNLDSKGYRTSIRLRKPPLLFIHSSSSVAIVWEANHLAAAGNEHFGLRWKPAVTKAWKPSRIRVERPEGESSWGRWIHSTILEDLQAGVSYQYELTLQKPHRSGKETKPRVFAKRAFTWVGKDGHAQPLTLHLAAVGDNQFRLAVFARIVARLAKLTSYLPMPTSAYAARRPITPAATQPNLLLHVGDAVQNPHDLDQWQTDFWDPLTRGWASPAFSGGIPILYGRGNHDFDPDGKNRYTAGLPAIQIGELNRTANRALERSAPFKVPATAEGDAGFSMHAVQTRVEGDRSTYHAYSPHPRCRVIVLDSNLEPSRMAPGVSGPEGQSEVDEQERWLVWEMGRQEWRDASLRIVIVHVPPFVELWKRHAWMEGGESEWALYVRVRFAQHFHGLSRITQTYDIPPASVVMSGHSHAYARGMLGHQAAPHYLKPFGSSALSTEARLAAKQAHIRSGTLDDGVVYTILGGAGGTFDTERVERWGFYERSVQQAYHFVHLTLDFANKVPGASAAREAAKEAKRETAWQRDKTKVYRLAGSQLPCGGKAAGVDRLIWVARGISGKLLDRFIIEAKECR